MAIYDAVTGALDCIECGAALESVGGDSCLREPQPGFQG